VNRNVEKAAFALLVAHDITRPPVPVDALAELEGAEVRYRQFDDDVSGLLLREEDLAIIGVNAGHAKTRQRFTIAHELGHLTLKSHKGRPVIVEHLSRARVHWRDGTSGQATEREEIEANQFAAALLMPQVMIEGDFWPLAGRHPHDVVVARMARRYGVSEQAMHFRLVNLALLDPM
jgi:Zn-dependent peptidase ImmA (M78 family)